MPKYEQLIFIDDSGDPGFKFSKGSSRHLILACVIFKSKISAEYTSASIKMLKEQLGWRQEREFKFHRANDTQKKLFFSTIRNHKFTICAIIIDKSKIAEPKLKKSDSFYNFAIKKLLDNADMKLARIALDGSGNRAFRKKATSEIRKSINANSHKMAEFRLVDSKDDVLIQLADMIAGAINAKYDKTKRLKHDYIKMVRKLIDHIDSL